MEKTNFNFSSPIVVCSSATIQVDPKVVEKVCPN